ncbi:hypothetical protein C8Q73DRAFT_664090 [Cubamyces lactineus]|nr:hypothetical protein C8Q73DRAFT_664090 [Cubamyces lactineus]
MTLFARLAVVAAALPFVFAHSGSSSSSSSSCSSSQFYYGEKECCLPHGGVPNPPKPPSGTSCPSSWYWHTEKSCCVPSSPPTSTAPPTCSSGWYWNTSGWHCSPQTSSVHTTSQPSSTPSKPGSCSSGEFYWGDKDCCLPYGGTPNPPKPPSGTSCPSNWEWHTGKSCCVPHSPPTSTPSCSNGWGWNNNSKCCEQPKPSSTPHSTIHTTPSPSPTSSKPGSCKNGEFYWGDKDCCLPYGGSPNPPQPPSGISCPSKWEWHTGKGCCVPHSPPPSTPPTCSNGWGWNNSSKCCEQPKPTSTPHTTYHPTTTSHATAPSSSPSDSCPSNHWFWSPKSCCLPHGGSPNPPQPPSGRSCPSNWEWHTGKSCCVPHHPNQPPPQCGSGWGWDDGSKCCFPHGSSTTSTPQPSSKPGKPGHSGGGWWKRAHSKSRAASLCPNGLDACPISGLSGLTGDFECVDIQNDIQSCGGCVSTGAGQDCTAIDGSWNVGCNNGKCVVFTCAAGYKRSADGSMCIKL